MTMEDLRIPGIIMSVLTGWISGIGLFGGIGYLVFGPINGGTQVWEIVGGLIGITLSVHLHFYYKKRNSKKQEQNE